MSKGRGSWSKAVRSTPSSRSIRTGARSASASAARLPAIPCLARSGTVWPDNSQAVSGGSRAEQPAGSAMKRVIAAMDEAYARLAEADRRQHEPLAIVGMACRSALGDDPEQLWQALLSGRDGV